MSALCCATEGACASVLLQDASQADVDSHRAQMLATPSVMKPFLEMKVPTGKKHNGTTYNCIQNLKPLFFLFRLRSLP
ncbi:hypothetical protein M434DRAFT_396246 [Hypoxylon sp. CO27-5]|nr:hypothetical protein M434DRAFT_396246 [Hypoxylon sp. CO27-5]